MSEGSHPLARQKPKLWTPEEPEFLSAAKVAKRLGYQERTVRRYIEEGRLPATKKGREWRIDLREAERVFKRKAAPTHESSYEIEMRLLKAERDRLWNLLESVLKERVR